MTTVLGFMTPVDYDDALGAGGTLQLIARIAALLPWGHLRLRDGERFVEVRADGTVVDKTFDDADDPDEIFLPTIRELGFVAWPSDAAPSMLPELIVPCFDGTIDVARLRTEPLIVAAGIRTIGNLDDGMVFLGESVDGASSEHQRIDAERLLDCAGALGLVMRYG